MSESREHPATPWYQRPIWIVVLLIVLFPVGLFLMWRYADWQPRTKKIVTSLWVWPMAVWWLWKGGRSRWEIGLASFAGLIWLVIVAGVFAGSSAEEEGQPAVVGQRSDTTATASPTSEPTSVTTQAPTETATPSPSATAAAAVATAQPATATVALTASATKTPSATPAATSVPTTGELAMVVGVTDGDTITVSINGASEKLRLIGINTPEIGECFASESTARLAQLVQGAQVRLASDVSDRDGYNRLLRYVYVGDVFVNDVMVREGYAQAYRYEPDTALASLLDASEAAAQSAGLGLWASDACGSATVAAIEVSAIHADAAGNDHDNLNDEWIELRNAGSTPIDFTSWGVKDDTASHRYSFPSGFALAPGATVRLYTGCGTNSAAALYWCFGSAIWNNSGDTIYVSDASGNFVVTREY